MTEPLSVYDPDSEETRKKKEKIELKPGDRCPTCSQMVERRADLNELRKVVMAYKLASGYELGDKSWDRAFFKIYIPFAKKMIEFLGDWGSAVQCIQDTSERIKDWNPVAHITLQKIVSHHMASWRLENRK